MSKALYNPKYFAVGSRKTANNANIIDFTWSHAKWNLKVNEYFKFPDEVADALLTTYGFLIEVTPKNIAEIKKMQTDKQFKCSECEFETDSKLGLSGHMRSHGQSEETKKFLEDIEQANPKGIYKESLQDKRSIDEQEGIPSGNNSDQDGVEWYGEGLETDKK